MIRGTFYRAEIYDNSVATYKTLDEVYAANKDRYPGKLCYVFNAHWFNGAGKPVGNYKAGGIVKAEEYTDCLGMGWSGDEKPVMGWWSKLKYRNNFLCTMPMIRDGEALDVSATKYGASVVRLCPDTGFGFFDNGEFCGVVGENMTSAALQAALLENGCSAFLRLDSGTSCQGKGPGINVRPQITVYSFLIVWIDAEWATVTSIDAGADYKRCIDVSEHQKEIDWERVREVIDYAIIRAGYNQTVDPWFIRNITECNRLGIPCGVYWFSYADNATEAMDEAARCLAAIKPYKVALPVMFDFEYVSANNIRVKGVTPTKALCSSICRAFCEAVEAAGYYAMVYTNDGFVAQYYDDAVADEYDLWLPTYPGWGVDLNAPPRACGIWQFSDKGAIVGITGAVDLNVVYRDYPEIIRKAGLNNLEGAAGEPEPSEETKPTEFELAADWAYKQGISDGTRPKDTATREEIWTMLYRALNK
ncbi:MAG: hypothetical protein EOM54_10485 [Clostridia bacterium]|nr:hypothetical protein [Clostridia bacterium]